MKKRYSRKPLQETSLPVIAHGRFVFVPFATAIWTEANILTATVGLITEPNQAEQIIASGEVDICSPYLSGNCTFNDERSDYIAITALTRSVVTQCYITMDSANATEPFVP
jgi:hypothetical protein